MGSRSTPIGLDRLRLRLDGHGDGQRKRLDMEQQRMARSRLARQRNVVHLHSAAVNSSYGGYIGYSVGSTGVVTVSGSGSTWNNSGELDVAPGTVR